MHPEEHSNDAFSLFGKPLQRSTARGCRIGNRHFELRVYLKRGREGDRQGRSHDLMFLSESVLFLISKGSSLAGRGFTDLDALAADRNCLHVEVKRIEAKWRDHRSGLLGGQAPVDLHDFFYHRRCNRKLVNCRSGDNLLIEVNKPIKGDVGGVDIEVVGLRGWVLGSHCFGLAVNSERRSSYLLERSDVLCVLSLAS